MKDFDISFDRFSGMFGTGVTEGRVQVWFDRLSCEYSGTGRHYHSSSHVAHCLQLFDEVIDDISDPLSVELAIWFHDVIYDPKQRDNEEKSSRIAAECLRELGCDDLTIANVVELIMVTKHPSEPMTKDERYLVDIDLSILGASESDYEVYESAIRKEYAHVPENDFIKGRYDLLNTFFCKSRIYESSYFHDRFEHQAKKNLVRTMRALTASSLGLDAMPAWRLAIYLGFYAAGLYVAGDLMAGKPYEVIAYGFAALFVILGLLYLKARHVETRRSKTIIAAARLALVMIVLVGMLRGCSG